MSFLENNNGFIQDELENIETRDTKENIPQKWYRSPVVQIAIISNILFILKIFGVFEPFGITEDSYKEVITAITTIINVIAYANNPKSKNNW